MAAAVDRGLRVARLIGDPTAGTCKAVLARADGLQVEMVRIPMGRGREALCVSSQVGCRMACSFCETGRMGRLADLDQDEILAQVAIARSTLGWAADSVVFQGMGEPLDNADNVLAAVRGLCDPRTFGYAAERLTVCTVGSHPGRIARLAALGLRRLNLSVSLVAGDEALRRRLVPSSARVPLAELQRALCAYRPRRNFQLGVHVCLLPGIHDRREHAARIADFCRPLGRVMVHLIPYNPGRAPLTRSPAEDEIVRFVGWLRDEGLPVRRRISKGRELMAACGQLGDPEARAWRAPGPDRRLQQPGIGEGA